MTAILIMSQNAHSCESVLAPEATPKPPQATTKPYSRHILGIYSGVQSHPKASLKPLQGHPKASSKPHQSHPNATLKPPQSHLDSSFHSPEGAESAFLARALALTRIFHTRDGGAPVSKPAYGDRTGYPSLFPGPTLSRFGNRRSGLSAFHTGCEITGLSAHERSPRHRA
jgi:hypothetical protein